MMKYPIERMLIKEFIVATIGRFVESRVGPTPLTPRDMSKPATGRGAYTPRPPTPPSLNAPWPLRHYPRSFCRNWAQNNAGRPMPRG